MTSQNCGSNTAINTDAARCSAPVMATVGRRGMKRKHFLIEFFGALGAQEVTFSDIQPNRISGTAVFDPNDPEECQDFCWHASDSDVPSDRVCRLAELMHKRGLVDIDRLTVTRDDLRQLYNQNESAPLSPEEFNHVLNTLEEVQVCMIDDGEETDTYFIHE